MVMPLGISFKKCEIPIFTPQFELHSLLPQNHFLSDLCSNLLNPPHLSLAKVVYQVEWCKIGLNTITIFTLSGKTVKLGFPTKAVVVSGIYNIAHTIISTETLF